MSTHSIFVGDSIANALIASITENSPSLDRAYFDTIELTDNQINTLCQGIINNTHLIYINLFGANLSADNLVQLKEAIKKNSQLKEIILENNPFIPDCQELIGTIRSILKERNSGASFTFNVK